MTPDMQRLCEAAENVMPVQFNGHGDFREGGKGPIAEAIVRAVLMALREPSAALKRQAQSLVERQMASELSGYYGSGEAASDRLFAATIDAILADPATNTESHGVIRTAGQSGPQYHEGRQGKGSWTD